MVLKSGLQVTIDTNFDTNPNFSFVSNAILSPNTNSILAMKDSQNTWSLLNQRPLEEPVV